jgi:type II secretory pathway pseudopilin PulG
MSTRYKSVAGVLAAVLVAGAAAATQEAQREAARLTPDETAAIAALRQLFTALEGYRNRYQNYPWSLAQLGPPEQGVAAKDAAGLIPVALARGEAGEYLVEYIPSDAALEGGPAAFEVVALPKDFSTGNRSFHLGPAGRIRHTREKRKARADDPLLEHLPLSAPRGAAEGPAPPPVAAIALSREETAALNRARRILQALETYRKRYGSYPQALAQLGPPEDGPPTKDAARLITGQLAAGAAQGYLFTYRMRPQAGPEKPAGFELRARPQEHGRTGHASFLADETGAIRCTTEPRDPTPNDPPVQ